jgi:hypothetical protein
MKLRRENSRMEENEGRVRPGEHRSQRRRRRWLRVIAIVALVLVVIGGVGRALLPRYVQNYVNRTLDRNPLYSGKIGKVQIHLWRGAYSIQDVSISKVTGNVPVPFFAAREVDFAIQRDALWHRKVVGRVRMRQAELNFVDAPSESESQTGDSAPWLQMIRDLSPFRINRAIIEKGTIHFRVFQSKNPVDVYLSEVDMTIDNLTNIRDETNPLLATIQARALAMDQAKLQFKMTLDPFSYRPTFHFGVRLLGLDVTKINDLSLNYGKFDFKRGWFDLVVEADAKEGQIAGYVKPLFRDVKIFSLTEDLKGGNVVQTFWQALVGAAIGLLKNQPRDQFGTLIPFSGDLSQATSANIFAAIANVLRNAFVRAYLPRLESGSESVGGLKFEPPDITDPITAGDTTPD